MQNTNPNRAGTIRSSAVSIHIRYGPCWYDTYSIRYTCTWLKVSKSIILYFNNKVNVLDWSIQWILQMLVLKHKYCALFSTNYKFNIIRIKLNMLKSFVNCIKIKCETYSFGSGMVVVFAAVTIICIGTVSVDVCIDTVPILTVLSQP